VSLVLLLFAGVSSWKLTDMSTRGELQHLVGDKLSKNSYNNKM